MKYCSRCNTTKPLAKFHTSKRDKYQAWCKVCSKEVNRAWQRSAKGKAKGRRNDQLKTRYGFTKTQYSFLLQSQNGRCAICNRNGTGSTRKLHLDHNHKTGKVRAILCMKCNLALGMVNDNVDILATMIEYLLKHS